MQSQLVCSGCRCVLFYPSGATNVSCALCNAITSVPLAGSQMSQLICGGCRTLLRYAHGATSVRCSCCQTVNLAPASTQLARMNCGNCRTVLMYPYGAPSVKCALCQYITKFNAMPHSRSQTVAVENPPSHDESGKLVSNVVVGVTKRRSDP